MIETRRGADLRIGRCDAWADAPAAWNELLARSGADTIFLTREWMESWWHAYGADRRLLILSFYEGDELIAVAPFYVAEARAELRIVLRVLRIVGDGSFDSDHLDVFCKPGVERHVARALCDWLTVHAREWDVLELGSVRAASPVLTALDEELGARQWRVRARETVHSAIALPATWDAFMSSLSSNMRSSVRRKERSLSSSHEVTYHRCEREEEIPAYLDALFRMHADRWTHRGQSGSFAEDERRALYEAIARRALAHGWLRFDRLDIDGTPAAIEFGLRYHDAHSFLQSGFVAELSGLSPGVVLKTHILKELIETGGRSYDFLHGDDAYKQRWSPAPVVHRHLQLALPRSAGAAFILAHELVQRGKEWLYRSVPEAMTSPLRRAFRKLRPYREELSERP